MRYFVCVCDISQTTFKMSVNSDNNQTFLTALPDDKQLHSVIINEDEDIDIDIKSSADSQDTLLDNGEIDEILAKQQSQQFSSIILKNHSVTDAVQDKM